MRSPAQLRAAIQRTAPPVLIALSVALIILGKADQSMFASLRTTVTDDSAPLLDTLSRPLGAATTLAHRVGGVVHMYRDNLRLERDNARLLEWQQVALKLAADNRELRRLVKAVPDKAVSYVTARVIGDTGGGFVRMLMINAGAEQGLARGQAAIVGAGLVGRLTEVGSRAARVLLLTDFNSRIPVTVGAAHVKAVLAGDNSARPRLLYVEPAGAAEIGDRVVTSGDGGVFPPGLPVGVVAAIDNGVAQVEPYVELSQLGYVMIVDYGLSAGLPQPPAAAARHGGKSAPAEAGLR